MLTNVHYRSAIIANCTQFTKACYIIVKNRTLELRTTAVFNLVCVLVTIVANIIVSKTAKIASAPVSHPVLRFYLVSR